MKDQRKNRQTINLMKCIAEGLDKIWGDGFTQYFNFEIEGKKITGHLKVEIKDKRVD